MRLLLLLTGTALMAACLTALLFGVPNQGVATRHAAPLRVLCRRFQWLFVRIEVELRKIQAYRPDLGVLVPTVGYAAHAHSSEAADSGSEDEGAADGGSGGGGMAATKTRALPVSTGAGPLPGRPRVVVRQLSGGPELEMMTGGRH